MSGGGRELPVRVPAHYDPATIDLERHAPWLVATLLEQGDSRELRWLVERFGRIRLAQWVRQRGARQLSTRSLALWRLWLEVEPSAPASGDALWRG